MFKKDLSSILGSFTKLLTKLDTYIEAQSEEIEASREKEREERIRRDAMSADLNRATTVRRNVRALIKE